MPTLTVVGHFSTALIVAWIVWLLWCAFQVFWYRRTATAPGPAIEPAVDVPPPTVPNRVVTLRAPDPMVRSMGAPPVARGAAQPTVDAPQAVKPQPAVETPPADAAASASNDPASPPPPEPVPGSDVKPFE